MVKIIDHYDYWNKNRSKRTGWHDREVLCMKILKSVSKPGFKILDAGCGNGDFMKYLEANIPEINLQGLDYSVTEVREARKKGLNVKQANFEEKIKLPSNSIDVAYAGELIEHLYNPDLFLSELNRIVKPGGFLLLATPNLCAWFNRILVPLGIQPLFVETSTRSKLIGAGPLKKLKKGSQPVGHIRIFNKDALVDILEANNFEVKHIRGAIYDEGLPRKLWFIDRMFKIRPSLSSNLLVLARKPGLSTSP